MNRLLLCLILGTISCSYEIIDLPNRQVEYTPPDHKYIVAVSQSSAFAADKETPDTWERLNGLTPSPPEEYFNNKTVIEIGSSFNNFGDIRYMEQFLDAHYCRGIWVITARIIRMGNLGSKHYNKIAVYYLEGESPVREWNRYEVELPGSTGQAGIYPRSVVCNEVTGEWFIGAYNYLLTTFDPTANNWNIYKTRDLFTGARRRQYITRVFAFGDSVYVSISDYINYEGFLYLKVFGGGLAKVRSTGGCKF